MPSPLPDVHAEATRATNKEPAIRLAWVIGTRLLATAHPTEGRRTTALHRPEYPRGVDRSRLLHPLAEGFETHPDRADVAVLLHGWTGSPAHMRILADELDSAGFGVIVPRLPGHGTEIQELLDHGWRDWLTVAGGATQRVLDGGGRLHLVGLSMGGILALLLASALDVASVATINAPVHVFSRSAPFAWVLRGSTRVRDDEPQDRSEDFAHEYAHHYEGTPLGSVAELMDLIRAAKKVLSRVSAPALVVQSLTDETVRPKSASYIYDRLGSPFKRLVWLERSAHVATLDSERHRLAQEVLSHMRDAQGLASLPRPG